MLKAENTKVFKANMADIIERNIISQFSWNTIIDALQSNFSLTKENVGLYVQQLIWLSTIINHPHFYKQIHVKLQSIVTHEKIDKEDIKIKIWQFIVAEQLEKKVQNLIFQIIYDFKTGYDSSAGYSNNYYLDVTKSFEISRSNFTKHIKNISELSMETVGLFYCSYQELDKYNTLVENKEITSLMKEIALKFHVDFFSLLIIKDRRSSRTDHSTAYSNRFNDSLLAIFNDYEDLKTYLAKIALANDKLKDKAKKYLKYANRAFQISDIQLQESFFPDETDKDVFKDAYFIDDLKMHI
jgi:hypothetical protein